MVGAGKSLFGRALGGGALTAGAYALSQGFRLISNLLLTRALFPEAFGIMALVSVVLVGLVMFSDLGVGPGIWRSPRGDDPAFLNTAWSINILRGLVLWLVTLLAAWPVSRLYEVPELAHLLPVAGLSLLISGFNPTRIDTANRHLMLGRVTLLDLLSQLAGMGVMVGAAYASGSVWALVIGALAGAGIKLLLCARYLPGARNRWQIEGAAARELISFGKWIFLSTACAFLLQQGDKAILGFYLSMQELGIYNIGWFLASFPMMIALAVAAKIMIPLYREHPPAESAANFRRLRQVKFVFSISVLAMLFGLAICGPQIVGLLYDARYGAAGAMVSAVALTMMPAALTLGYDQVALSAGDGRGFFIAISLRALLQTTGFFLGAHFYGLGGALAGQCLGVIAAYPCILWLARRHKAWDGGHDGVMALVTAAFMAIIWGLRSPQILTLFP